MAGRLARWLARWLAPRHLHRCAALLRRPGLLGLVRTGLPRLLALGLALAPLRPGRLLLLSRPDRTQEGPGVSRRRALLLSSRSPYGWATSVGSRLLITGVPMPVTRS